MSCFVVHPTEYCINLLFVCYVLFSTALSCSKLFKAAQSCSKLPLKSELYKKNTDDCAAHCN